MRPDVVIRVLTGINGKMETRTMQLFNFIHYRHAAVFAVLLLLAPTANSAAADWPDSLNAKKAAALPSDPQRFVDASLENYLAELEKMRQLYEALGGVLPSDAEVFFSSAEIPEPPECTLQVEADVLSNPLPPAGVDKRRPGIICRLNGTLSTSRSGGQRRHRLVRREAEDFLRESKLSKDSDIDAVLAADGKTADLLGIQRLLYVHVNAQTLAIIGGSGGGKSSSEGDVPLFLDEELRGGASGFKCGNPKTRPVYKVQWGEGIVGESNGRLSRIYGQKPGVYDIYVTGYNVYKDAEWKDRLLVGIKTHKEKRYPVGRVLVVEAQSLGVRGGGRSATMPPLVGLQLEDWDGRVVPDRSRLQPVAEVDAGQGPKPVPVNSNKVRIHTFDSGAIPVGWSWDRDHIALYFSSGRPGTVRFRFDSLAQGETALNSPVYEAGLNRIKLQFDPPLRYGCLNQDTAYTVRAVATGGASMEDWKATWHGPLVARRVKQGVYRRVKFTDPLDKSVAGDWGKTESFTQAAGGNWEVATALNVSGTGDDKWTADRLKRALFGEKSELPLIGFKLHLQNSAGRGECTIEFPTRHRSVGASSRYRIEKQPLEMGPPAMQSFALEGSIYESGWRNAPCQIDLFTADRNSLTPRVDFRYGAAFANGIAVTGIEPPRVRWASLKADPPNVLRAIGADAFGCQNTRREPASVEIHARADGPQLARNTAVTFEGESTEILSPVCTVTVNRLTLDSVREGDKLVYRLFSFGAADMSQYRARWNVRLLNPRAADSAISRKFRKVGAERALSTQTMGFTNDIADGYVQSVQVLNADGTVVADLDAGAALNDTVEVTLYVPEKAPPNSRVMALVHVRNLPPELAARTTCRWTVTPAVGRFEKNDTPLVPDPNGLFRSTTFLRVANSANLAGQRPGVHVDLVMGD